ncbi:MAG: prepilin-type N-terminal cleavage/methylation domain-containing protein [Candidatus Saccharimonadaceae bacterium]
MSFTDIKTKSQGFTIVELLIVVVVIAILAAITIVSYNGITNRANASSAAATAASLQKKSELYAADGPTKLYPASLTTLNSSPTLASDSWYIASGTIKTTAVTTNPDASNGKDTVRYQPCGTGPTTTAPTSAAVIVGGTGAITGAIISYWGFSGTTVNTITLGQTSGVVGANNVGCATAV